VILLKETKYRVSDFIYDAMKKLPIHLAYYAAGFVAYAFTVGHIVKDEQVEMPAKQMNLCVYSAILTALFCAVICAVETKNVSRKTLLIEASREDDFDEKLYFKNTFIREVLPFFAAGVVILIPYSIFYAKFGFGYEYSIFIDRIFASTMLFVLPLGPFIGIVANNAVICFIYARHLHKLQRNIIDDRMWLKDAPKQEVVNLNPPKDNYKNY
jgi:hypothetical protein